MGVQDPIARDVVVRGRVQGVYFRWSCRQEAAVVGAYGWIRNEYDGSVRAHFEGPPPAVEHMVSWVHQGPPSARVDRVDVDDTRPDGCVGFEVR